MFYNNYSLSSFHQLWRLPPLGFFPRTQFVKGWASESMVKIKVSTQDRQRRLYLSDLLPHVDDAEPGTEPREAVQLHAPLL